MAHPAWFTPGRTPRIGTLSSIDSAAATAVVVLDEASIDASYTMATATLSAGTKVLLLPVGSMWLMVAGIAGTGAAGVALGPNLLANPSMEYGSPGAPPSQWSWGSNQACSAVWSTTSPHTGSACAEISLSPNAGYGPAAAYGSLFMNTTDPVQVDAGVTYKASVWVAGGTGVAKASLMTITGSTPPATEAFSTGTTKTLATVTNPGAAWQLLEGQVLVPAGHSLMRVYAYVEAATGVTASARVDDAALQQKLGS